MDIEQIKRVAANVVAVNDAFMKASEMQSNHRTVGLDDYFGMAFPAIETLRNELLKLEGK